MAGMTIERFTMLEAASRSLIGDRSGRSNRGAVGVLQTRATRRSLLDAEARS